MNFNYGYEKKIFELEWAKKKALMIEAGMNEFEIGQMYEFDWEWFKNIRRYQNHISDIYAIEEIYDKQTFEMEDGLELTEQLCNIGLVTGIKALSNDELQLLVKIVLEDKKQIEVAREMSVSPRVIHYKFLLVKEKIKRFMTKK